MPSISTGVNHISVLPSTFGGAAGSGSSELTGWYINKQGEKVLKGEGK